MKGRAPRPCRSLVAAQNALNSPLEVTVVRKAGKPPEKKPRCQAQKDEVGSVTAFWQ